MKKLTIAILFIALFTTFANAQKKPKVDLAKKIAAATPQALPQSPVAEKLKSDAQDKNLKGKVKSVIEEYLVNGKRERNSEEYFNESGNLIKSISYDEGYPIGVSVWGYIDGNRVNLSNDIEYEDGERPAPRNMSITVSAEDNAINPNAPRDNRYGIKFTYKYDEQGRLTEEWLYQNNGEVWTHTIYKYKGNQIEELNYDQSGQEISQTFKFLDKGGNIIEQHLMDADGKIGDDDVFRYKFDKQGNSIIENALEKKKVKGKTVLKPLWTIYRTITYYP